MIVSGELVRKKIFLPHSRTAELRFSIFKRVEDIMPVLTQSDHHISERKSA